MRSAELYSRGSPAVYCLHKGKYRSINSYLSLTRSHKPMAILEELTSCCKDRQDAVHINVLPSDVLQAILAKLSFEDRCGLLHIITLHEFIGGKTIGSGSVLGLREGADFWCAGCNASACAGAGALSAPAPALSGSTELQWTSACRLCLFMGV